MHTKTACNGTTKPLDNCSDTFLIDLISNKQLQKNKISTLIIPGRKLKGTMGQISAGPSGVFGAKGPGDSRLYYLNASRGIINPSEELLDDSDWIQVISKKIFI